MLKNIKKLKEKKYDCNKVTNLCTTIVTGANS